MRKTYGALVLGFLVTACGGGADEAPPVQAPPPPVASAAPAPPPVETPAPPAPPKASLAELQQTTLKAYVDGFTDAKKVASLYAEDAQLWIPGTPEVKGREAILGYTQSQLDSSSNVKFGFNRQWIKGDTIVVEWTATGTQTKEWMGVPASEKPWGVTGASILTFNQDGLIAKDHRYFDFSTVLSQLGASKQKARGIPALPTAVETHTAKGDAQEEKEVEWAKSLNAAFDKHDSKAFLDMLTDETLYDDATMPTQMKGKAGAKQFFESFTKAFPDLKIEAGRILAVEDFVIQEYAINGTHKAALTGPQGTIPATKKPINLHSLDIQHLKDGKLAHGWTYANGFEFATQLGLVPPPGAKAADKGKPAEKKPADKAGETPAKTGSTPPKGATPAPPAKK
jgi:steroid delta-isomerase-like uncharacterized protein